MRRMLTSLLAVASLALGCSPPASSTPEAIAKGTQKPQAEAAASRGSECVPPKTTRRAGMKLTGYCPESEPVAVGHSEQLVISMIHRHPCWQPPDFARRFWRVRNHAPLSKKTMSALHGGVTGEMKLVSQGTAVFKGPAIKIRQRANGPWTRIPASGSFYFQFDRIRGGIRRASCG